MNGRSFFIARFVTALLILSFTLPPVPALALRESQEDLTVEAIGRRLLELGGPLSGPPAGLEEKKGRILVEQLARRWAYQRRGKDGAFCDTLAQMIRSTLPPEQAGQILQEARAMGIPVEAVPHNFSSRTAGIVLPLYAIRSNRNQGIGDIHDLGRFIKWASQRGFRRIYVMPVMETDSLDPSPYFTLSAFAGNPLYIALDDVPEVQRSRKAQAALQEFRPLLEALRRAPRVDYNRSAEIKLAVLRQAYAHFKGNVPGREPARAAAFRLFQEENAYWLEDYLLFRTMAGAFKAGWRDFPADLRDRKEAALAAWRQSHQDEMQFYAYVQFLFEEQWQAMRRQAHEEGIRIMGDIPSYVDGDAAWRYQRFFQMDWMTGAGPDHFSLVGQEWGHLPYDWDAMAREDYRLAVERMRRVSQLSDDVRMDHFVGLHTFRRIPRRVNEAKWRRENLADLFAVLQQAWEERFGAGSFPLHRVDDRGQVPKEILSAGRRTWGEGDHYLRPGYFWASGRFGDLTESDKGAWIHPIMRMLDSELKEGPSHTLVQRFLTEVAFERLGELIPEDFGGAFPKVELMRREAGLPRSRPFILGLGELDPDYWNTAEHHPNSVAMSATHDTATLAGEIEAMLRSEDPHHQEAVKRLTGVLAAEGLLEASSEFLGSDQRVQAIQEALLRKMARGNSRNIILTYQDLMGLGNGHRTTPPGGQRWSDRMPVTVDALLANEEELARRTNERVERVLGDPQARRRPEEVVIDENPAILGMLPMAGHEGEVRVRRILHPGEKIQVWAVVAPARSQREPGQEPQVQFSLWWSGEPIETARHYPMRLYAALPDGSRLYYGETSSPSEAEGRLILSTRVLSPSGEWLRGAPPYLEPFLEFQSGLEEATPERLAASLLHYREGLRELSPQQQFERSFVAERLVQALEEGLKPFSELFGKLADLVEGPAGDGPLWTSDLARVMSDLRLYRPDLTERLHRYLVEIAVLSQESSPQATQAAIKVLRASDIGEVVLVALETNFTSSTGGLGLYIRELSSALAGLGISVTVVTPLLAEDKERIVKDVKFQDTGKSVTVKFLDEEKGKGATGEPLYGEEWAVGKIHEARVGVVRLLGIEQDKYFQRLKGGKGSLYLDSEDDFDKAFRLRAARMLSLGALLALREMNIHAGIILTNDGFSSYLPLYLEEGDDVDLGNSFRRDPRLKDAETAHVIHTAHAGYQFIVRDPRHRDQKLLHDLGRDLSLRHIPDEEDRSRRRAQRLHALVNPGNPQEINALQTAVTKASRVVTVGRGYLDDTLDPAQTEAFRGIDQTLRAKRDLGRYTAIPNGVDTVGRQKKLFKASLLEMGHEADRRGFARRIFEVILPERKRALQEAFGLAWEGRDTFIYSMLARIDRTKGFHLLTKEVWSAQHPGELRVMEPWLQDRFKGDVVYSLSEKEREKLLAYAKDNGRTTLRALEAAFVLMPELQVVLAGSAGEPFLDKQFREIAQRFNLRNLPRRLAYHPARIEPSDSRYHLIYTGSTLFGQPSEAEAFGLAAREAEAGGVPSHRHRSGGLRDGEIRLEGVEEGFEPFHPVAWLASLRHLYSVYKENRSLWDEFRFRALTQDNRWLRPAKEHLWLFRRMRQERFQRPPADPYVEIDLPALEVAAALHRAERSNQDPANTLAQDGFTLEEAVNIALTALARSSQEALIRALREKHLKTLAAIKEKIPDDLRQRLNQAAAGAGLEEPLYIIDSPDLLQAA
ncbi:MAG: 4-alpha-glucanotransferase [Candidatus Omnitrophica bacterium]|nr:4-alpha-glucanotransferase [Candidatus Omnitrophota bacterium]